MNGTQMDLLLQGLSHHQNVHHLKLLIMSNQANPSKDVWQSGNSLRDLSYKSDFSNSRLLKYLLKGNIKKFNGQRSSNLRRLECDCLMNMKIYRLIAKHRIQKLKTQFSRFYTRRGLSFQKVLLIKSKNFSSNITTLTLGLENDKYS